MRSLTQIRIAALRDVTLELTPLTLLIGPNGSGKSNLLTAPSKRLLTFVPGYNKTTHGPLVTEKVGVDGPWRSCPRFGAWLSTLESLGETQQ